MKNDSATVTFSKSTTEKHPCLRSKRDIILPARYEWAVPEVMLYFCFDFEAIKKEITKYYTYPFVRIGSYQVQQPFHCSIASICVDESDGIVYLIRASAAPEEIEARSSKEGNIQFLNSSVDQLAQSLVNYAAVKVAFNNLTAEQSDADEPGEAIMRDFKDKMMALDPAIWESGYSYWCESIEDYLADW